MMRSGQFELPSLVTHEFPIERMAEALDQAGKANEAQKVCISF
jgi:threonine dehydrogenase-like Zn-dependent dehydrogenase